MNYRFTLENETLGTLVLESSPVDYENLSIKLQRDPKYHGVNLDFPIALRAWCKAGREYILSACNTLGIDAQVYLRIEMSCGCDDQQESAPDYSVDYSDDYGSNSGVSDCDWSLLTRALIDIKEIKRDPDYISFSLIQSSEHQKFQNRLDNTVSLSDTESLDGEPVDTLDPIDFTLHNKGIVLVSKSTVLEEISFVDYGESGFDNSVNVHTPPFIFGDENFIQEAYDLGITIDTDNLALPNIYENITPFTRTVTIDFRIKYQIQGGTCGSNTGQYQRSAIYIAKYLNDVDVAFNLELLDFADTCNGANPNRDISYTKDLEFLPGEKFKLWVTTSVFDLASGAVAPFYQYDSDTCYFNLKGELPFPETITKAFGIHETGALIAQRILSKNNAFYSETYGRKNSWPITYTENGCKSFGVLTQGLQIRAFPYDKNPIRLSADTLYSGLNPIDNLGMGIKLIDGDYKLIIETKDKFYKRNVLFRLKNVPNVKTSYMQEYFMNEFRIGFDKWETEEVSGIDEFNTKRYYNTGIKAVSNTIEKFSTFIASGYSIELTRRKQWKNDNTNEDYKNDNETFIIATNRSLDGANNPNMMNYAEKSENYTDVTGIYSPKTCYNLRLSPERNKLNHAGVISPALLKYPGRVLKFTYGEGNYKAAYRGTDECDVYNNRVLAADASIPWDDPNIKDSEPIWDPLVDEFSYPLSAEQIQMLINDPEASFEYSEGEEDFILVSILEADMLLRNGMTKFKVLRAEQE